MAEFGTIVFDKLIYDLCKNGWRPDLRGWEVNPLELKDYFGVEKNILGIVDSEVLKNSIEVVKEMKPNTQFSDFMDNRIDNFKNALLLVFLVAAREKIYENEKKHATQLNLMEAEIKRLSVDIEQGIANRRDVDEIKKLQRKRRVYRIVRSRTLTENPLGLPISVKINFTDSLVHPEGETIDPIPDKEGKMPHEEIDYDSDEVKSILEEIANLFDGKSLLSNKKNFKAMFGISPNLEVSEEGAGTIVDGFNNNTYALYCGD